MRSKENEKSVRNSFNILRQCILREDLDSDFNGLNNKIIAQLTNVCLKRFLKSCSPLEHSLQDIG